MAMMERREIHFIDFHIQFNQYCCSTIINYLCRKCPLLNPVDRIDYIIKSYIRRYVLDLLLSFFFYSSSLVGQGWIWNLPCHSYFPRRHLISSEMKRREWVNHCYHDRGHGSGEEWLIYDAFLIRLSDLRLSSTGDKRPLQSNDEPSGSIARGKNFRQLTS